jgi:hypothetical protein
VEVLPVVREYSELMEMVDHAVDFDWTTAGLTLGQKSQFEISEEQRNLLYSQPPGRMYEDDKQQPTAFPLTGWGSRNIVSARNAWARVRLREYRVATTTVNPTVAQNTLSLPPPKGAATPSPKVPPLAVWHNEEKAEEDQSLAVLSEGVQIYLKGVLEKALHCARQRQNLDGIRLWHQQCVTDDDSKPALALRLGCDVSRQFAQASGNAAMTCKRMEEALERQSGVPGRDRKFTDETLTNATCMADLSLRPKLANGAEDADHNGKRCYEIYGGKESGEPPFGRVPKQAKLEVGDFEMAQYFGVPGRHRAATVSSSFLF